MSATDTEGGGRSGRAAILARTRAPHRRLQGTRAERQRPTDEPLTPLGSYRIHGNIDGPATRVTGPLPCQERRARDVPD